MTSRIAALLAVLVVLPGTVYRMLNNGPLLAREVADRLPANGIESPVTAVLLNFRALDTLLEVAVLAAAVIGALALTPAGPAPRATPPNSLLPRWLVPRLAPLIGLLVVYLWWAGSTRPGGAFQAGAALTGLLLLFHFTSPAAGRRDYVRLALTLTVAGPLLFLAIGLLPLITGSPFLDYPEEWDKAPILAIEAGLTASAGAGLALLAVGGGKWR